MAKDKESKLGQEPAFPFDVKIGSSKTNWGKEGMSKRFYAACAAMKGLLSNATIADAIRNIPHENELKSVVKASYEYADELLKQENE
jgi:hypothetical protein